MSPLTLGGSQLAAHGGGVHVEPSVSLEIDMIALKLFPQLLASARRSEAASARPQRFQHLRAIRVLGRRYLRPMLAETGPIVGVVLIVLFLGWRATAEYGSQKAALIVMETNRYLTEFQNPPVADAWRRLSEVWQAEQDRQRILLSRIVRLPFSERDVQLTHYQQFVVETVQEYRLERDIETVLRFFRRVASCIRVGGCDRTAVAHYFGSTVQAFRDQHYPYFEQEYPEAGIDLLIAEISPPEHAIGTDAMSVP